MVDYLSALSIDLRLISPEITLVIGSFAILFVSCVRSLRSWAPTITVITYAIALWLTAGQWGHQGSGFADMVVCDSFGVMFKLIFIVACIITVFLGYRYLTAKGIHRPEYYALMLISSVGMMAMANTADLVVMFIGLEVMSVPLYAMAGMNRRSLESNEASIKYFI
ncbi:hypothetical protein GF377_07390, partial [candidate division GN15 bacterium]|nr:hypothetical protein [candidate division GN15 bacterium]